MKANQQAAPQGADAPRQAKATPMKWISFYSFHGFAAEKRLSFFFNLINFLFGEGEQLKSTKLICGACSATQREDEPTIHLFFHSAGAQPNRNERVDEFKK